MNIYLTTFFISLSLFAQTDKTSLDKGKRVYLSNCISCHHKDPNLKGSLGPELTNVPFAVLEAKVLTGKYPDPLPPDFKPRRKTKMMKPLPKVKNDLKVLHAWIESMKKK